MKRKAEQKVYDKKELLIVPLLDDALLRKAAEALQPYFPQQIYALTASASSHKNKPLTPPSKHIHALVAARD